MANHGDRFRRRALSRGYKADEVDAFLDRVEATLAGEPMGSPVPSQEVDDVVFRVRFGGYDEWQVDVYLDRVARQLGELEERGVLGRAPSPEFVNGPRNEDAGRDDPRDMGPSRDMSHRDPRDMPPRDMPPRDMPPHDMPPRDMPPHDMPPRDMPPHDMPPRDMREAPMGREMSPPPPRERHGMHAEPSTPPPPSRRGEPPRGRNERVPIEDDGEGFGHLRADDGEGFGHLAGGPDDDDPFGGRPTRRHHTPPGGFDRRGDDRPDRFDGPPMGGPPDRFDGPPMGGPPGPPDRFDGPPPGRFDGPPDRFEPAAAHGGPPDRFEHGGPPDRFEHGGPGGFDGPGHPGGQFDPAGPGGPGGPGAFDGPGGPGGGFEPGGPAGPGAFEPGGPGGHPGGPGGFESAGPPQDRFAPQQERRFMPEPESFPPSGPPPWGADPGPGFDRPDNQMPPQQHGFDDEMTRPLRRHEEPAESDTQMTQRLRRGPEDRFGPPPPREPGGPHHGGEPTPPRGMPSDPTTVIPHPAGPPPQGGPGGRPPSPYDAPGGYRDAGPAGPPPAEPGGAKVDYGRRNPYEGRGVFDGPGRHGREEMTTELRSADSPFKPEDLQRLEQLRGAFQPRRFGSGYDPAQVDRIFDAMSSNMTGRSPVPVSDKELDTSQFSLVQRGYFEAEVDAALREVRDIFAKRGMVR